MRKAAIYCRVSTPGQEQEGISLQTQKEKCLEKAGELGLEVPNNFLITEQASGADRDRPGITKLKKLIRSGEIEAVICYAPDRLYRDAIGLMLFTEEAKDAGVSVIFLQGPSGDTPEDRLLQYILGYVGEKERQLIKERTRRAKEAWARAGRMPNGCGVGIYGYDYNPETKRREINPAEAQVVRQMFELAASGWSYHRIARWLNDQGIPSKKGKRWTDLTVRHVLLNPAYMGKTYWGREITRKVTGNRRIRKKRDPQEWVLIEGYTPPIVSESLWKQAHFMVTKPKPQSGKPLAEYLLTGFMVCAECNGPFIGARHGEKYRYYRCSNSVPRAGNPAKCSQTRRIRADEAEKLVWEVVEQVLTKPELITEKLKNDYESAIEDYLIEKSRLSKQLADVKKQEAKIIEAFTLGFSRDLVEQQAALIRQKRVALERELQEIENRIESAKQVRQAQEQAIEIAAKLKDSLHQASFDDKRRILTALQIKIIASPEELRITGVLPTGETSVSYRSQATNMGMTTWTQLPPPIGRKTPGLEGPVVSRATCSSSSTPSTSSR